MTVVILAYLLILLVAALVGGVVFKTLKQPPVIGYLLAGLVLGILFGKNLVHETVNFLAELGVVLLLFTLGVEFSFSRFRKFTSGAVVGGIVQILATVVVLTILIFRFGFGFYEALFMSAAFSLSSTAVVVKLLTDRGEMDTLPGEILVTWSVIQDIAFLPMIVLLPVIGKELFVSSVSGVAILVILKNIGFAALFVAFAVVFGRQVIPFIVKKVASINSRELLLVTVFAIAVAGAFSTQLMGFSAALGAFFSGLLISKSVEQHAIFSEIRPLRDIFLLLFFTSLGLVLPQGFIFSHFLLILMLTGLVMFVKFIIVMILTLYNGYHAKTSFIVSVGLIEVGELAFVLAGTGLALSIIDAQVYALILSVALLSILIMPPLYIAAPSIYMAVRDFSKVRMNPVYVRFFTKFEKRDILEELPFKDHVVLCGYGRVGKYIGRALEMAEVPYVVVEYNHQKAKALREKGVQVVYGDPSDIDILDFAQVDKAKAVVIAIPDLYTQQQVITHSQTLNKSIEIFCRTHHEEHQQLLKALGVTTVIQPEFEASLSMVNKILKSYGEKDVDIEGKISRLKIEHGLG